MSPFMPMDQSYAWRFVEPSRRLVVHMETVQEGSKRLDATLVLRRRPFTQSEWRRLAWTYPFMTHRVIAGIYLQALKLWRKGVPYHSHPAKAPQAEVRP